eukprot:TRINITY_DN19698_c0_g2_i3.p1 TRINITY_DN19698_c0_g2~~TRINITY_DN19698_c0_g2_i3.p1  ORF type:complete len:124 (-),score=33.75 TRINITY_DN19698_c0_g2_i3:63-434(-)
MVHEEIQARKEYLDSLRELFEALDFDGNGSITAKEFNRSLMQEKVQAFFYALRLDVRDAHRLFELLDQDNSGEVTIDEFIDGCYLLQGEASSFEAKLMHLEVTQTKQAIAALVTGLKKSGIMI